MQPAASEPFIGLVTGTSADGIEQYCALDSRIGKARIDDRVSDRNEARHDAVGLLGVRGRGDGATVGAALVAPSGLRQPPEWRNRNKLLGSGNDRLSLKDGAARLAAVTDDAIARSAQFLPAATEECMIAGSGRRNQAIMRCLNAKIAQPIFVAEDAGSDDDAVEAHFMAYLATRFVAGLPSTYSQTIGVRRPVICGRLHSHLLGGRQ